MARAASGTVPTAGKGSVPPTVPLVIPRVKSRLAWTVVVSAVAATGLIGVIGVSLVGEDPKIDPLPARADAPPPKPTPVDGSRTAGPPRDREPVAPKERESAALPQTALRSEGEIPGSEPEQRIPKPAEARQDPVAPTNEATPYRARWEKAVVRAGLRDYEDAIRELETAAGSLSTGPVRDESATDLEIVRGVWALHRETLEILSKWPAERVLALAYVDETGNLTEFEGSVARAEAHRIELKEGGKAVVVEFGEVLARSLADVFKQRGAPVPVGHARAAAAMCLAEGDPDVAERYHPESTGTIPTKYWAYGRQKAGGGPEVAKGEGEARNLFFLAEKEYRDSATRRGAGTKYKTLLSDHADTSFVTRNRASILDRIGALEDAPPAEAAKPDTPRNPPPPSIPPKVDQKRVDEAILKGIRFLKTAASPAGHSMSGIKDSDELVLWTFLHAGVPETDPRFKALVKKVLEAPLERTYSVSLTAMCLETLERVKYQGRIAQCAQFLVDNQCQNGQWSYGEPSKYVKDTPTAGSERKEVASAGGVRVYDPPLPRGLREKPKVKRKITVRKMGSGPATGDNSNAQYAALGLRACFDAGIILPKEVIALAAKWWRESQLPDEQKATGYGVRGWGYGHERFGGDGAYGSMTAGAVGSLLIYDHLQGADWKKNTAVKSGLNWLAHHFTVTENIQATRMHATFLYYYLYALERVGMLYGTETLGRHEWYTEGAKFILDAQKADGSWAVGRPGMGGRQMGGGMGQGAHATWDTCFAILFLRRATRPLVASVDPRD